MTCAFVFIAAVTILVMVGMIWDMAVTLKHNKNLSKGDQN